MKLLILVALMVTVVYSSRPEQLLDWDIEQRDTWTYSKNDRAPGLLAGLGAGYGAGQDEKSGKPGLGDNVGWGVFDIKGEKRLGGGSGAGIGSGQDNGRGRW